MSNAVDDRQVKSLPTVEYCIVYLEEQLYAQAFALLSNVVASDGSVQIPAQVLALIATLTVHPRFTTRPHSQHRVQAAKDALRYLRLVIKKPRSDSLKEAFRFTGQGNSRPRVRASETPTGGHTGARRTINNIYADKESLWSNADSFWGLVGWAFNCSVVYPSRWQWYKSFLGVVLDFLDDDLDRSVSRAPPHDVVHSETMIAQYLAVIGGGRSNRRRVLRAILSDGQPKSMAEFGEIWPGETKGAKKKEVLPIKKRPKLDLENEEYGDYYDDESDDESLISEPELESEPPLPNRRTRQRSQSPPSLDNVDSFGGIESIRLRQRLIATLVRLSEASPASFLDTEDLFDLLTEFLRPLPLNIFQQFVLPLCPYLSPNHQTSLNEMLFRPLAPISGSDFSLKAISHMEFQTRYAMHAAVNTSAVDNAKVGLLTESLLRSLWKSKSLEPENVAALRLAVDQGIQARSDRVSRDRRKKANTDEAVMQIMQSSATRMRLVLDVSETSHQHG